MPEMDLSRTQGVPDRMILFPGGIIAFVELKRPGAKVKAGGIAGVVEDEDSELRFPCYEISTAGTPDTWWTS